MTLHLIPTEAEFADYVRSELGEEASLHPANRLTSCGRHMSGLSTTTRANDATCKVCIKRGASA